MSDFDFKPVYEKMISLYRYRTENLTIDNLAPDYRVRWSEVFSCMREHGYTKTVIEGRAEWYEAVGKKYDRECSKINKEILGGNK